MSFDTIIKNGLLVYPEKTHKGSIGISGETITVLPPDTGETAASIVDATGMYIFPGFIDPHVHPAYVDDIGAVSKTGAAGGVTTILHYTSVKPGESAADALSKMKETGETISFTDFALHASLFDTLTQCSEIPALAAMGVRSIKMFTAYQKLGWMTGDYALVKAMDMVAAEKGIVSVHAENGCIIDFLEEQHAPVTAENFLKTSPAILDKEAIFRVLATAKTTGCNLYLPHISSQKGLEAMALGREEGIRFYSETCPHYLAFSWDELKSRGPLGRLRPPIKNAEDRDALWAALADGIIDTIGSDHAPKDKNPGDDFASAPYGAPGVQTILPVLWELGVNRGKITASDLVRLCAENPAKIFGLADKKGRLADRLDADIIIFDPTESWTITKENQLSNAPYTLYEGMKIQGKIVKVFQRGKLIVDDNIFVAETPDGKFLATNPE